jgi:ribonuclease R
MRSAEKIVRLMLEKNYVPLPLPRIAELCGIGKGEMGSFRDEVDTLRMAGVVVVMKKERLTLANDYGEFAFGKMHFHSGRGPALFIPDDKDSKTGDLIVESSDASNSLNRDRVLVRILPRKGSFGRGRSRRDCPPPRYACVLCVIERASETFVGTLTHSGRTWLVTPDDPRIRVHILVPDPEQCHISPRPKVGDCVSVRLVRWDNPNLPPEGTIAEVFGKARTPDAEYKSLLSVYNLSTDFPINVEEETEKLPDKVTQSDLKGRVDLRNKRIFTIDPDTAKDFDDALGIEHLDGGGWRVGIHIADVSHYVRTGSSLDSEAHRRGNSTYLVGTTIPMLPHKLSSGLCSLVENEDRLTKSVFVEFDARGHIISGKTTFANTVINSIKRLTYRQAIAFIRENDLSKIRNLPVPAAHETGHAGRALKNLSDDELLDLQHDIRAMWKIADRMRRERMFAGALDLDMPEIALHVDADGYACGVEKLEYDESHQLVEEFMLAANEAVARKLSLEHFALIHRVHDKPEEESLQELAQYLRDMGLDAHDLSSRKELCRVMDLIHAHPQSRIMTGKLLRSMKQACYRATPDGHFGLNMTYYTHFTSPIRRYSDLVVHRIFDEMLQRASGSSEKPAHHYAKAELAGIAEHLSQTEQNSTLAERDSVKVKTLEYLQRECEGKPDVSFESVIMDIRRRGIFVELENSLAYGMLPVSLLRDDNYIFDESSSRYRGRRTGRVFRIGDSMRVMVAKVDRARRLVDFAPIM